MGSYFFYESLRRHARLFCGRDPAYAARGPGAGCLGADLDRPAWHAGRTHPPDSLASASTVRAHLKHVFRKCGVHSQAELVRLLALGPYWG
ncbi:MAG: hypothetical protein JJT88_13430 [Gammaproteobacteria bacterium]|nr:hypothetical protein [Gammaproteobacteria bacterium]